jgi:endonuclease/exonuclease/phosphatase family metal-dependent hydrolase
VAPEVALRDARSVYNHPDSTLPNAVDWNMHANADSPARLMEMIDAGGSYPRAIALQEVCGHRFTTLLGQLTVSPYNYQGYFEASNPAGCGGNGHGNAVFWRGGCDGDCRSKLSYQPIPNTVPSYDHDDHRLAVCGQTNSAAYKYFVACSTHLFHDSDSWAAKQLYEFGNLVWFYSDVIGVNTYAMGDFNFNPNQNFTAADAHDVDWMLNRFDEMDGCGGGCTATHVNQGKIDYIFLTKGAGHCHRAHPGFVSANPSPSDHQRLRGYFQCS